MAFSTGEGCGRHWGVQKPGVSNLQGTLESIHALLLIFQMNNLVLGDLSSCQGPQV